jgi:hypothetical protein
MMRLSREVFQECKEVAPVADQRRSLTHRLFSLLTGKRAA